VPFRETGDGHRTRLWDFVRARLEHQIDIEIVVGTDDGSDPFNKSMAFNDAASRATGDLFYMLDADCVVPGAQVREAGAIAKENGWSRPWHRKVKLGQADTEEILRIGPADWDGTSWNNRPDRVNAFFGAPPLMITREVYFDVGGMDERYRGWGGEDWTFARKVWKLGYGLYRYVQGTCVHLWHPRIGDYGHDLWAGQDGLFPNRELDLEYNRAQTPEQMRALVERSRREPV
jgi:hypothetical protein